MRAGFDPSVLPPRAPRTPESGPPIRTPEADRPMRTPEGGKPARTPEQGGPARTPETGRLTYVRASMGGVAGSPADWHQVEVLDTRTGEQFTNVVEACVRRGFVLRYVTEPGGRLAVDRGTGMVRTERIEAPIRLRRRGEP